MIRSQAPGRNGGERPRRRSSLLVPASARSGQRAPSMPGSGATLACVKLQVLARAAEGVILKGVHRLLSWKAGRARVREPGRRHRGAPTYWELAGGHRRLPPSRAPLLPRGTARACCATGRPRRRS